MDRLHKEKLLRDNYNEISRVADSGGGVNQLHKRRSSKTPPSHSRTHSATHSRYGSRIRSVKMGSGNVRSVKMRIGGIHFIDIFDVYVFVVNMIFEVTVNLYLF